MSSISSSISVSSSPASVAVLVPSPALATSKTCIQSAQEILKSFQNAPESGLLVEEMKGEKLDEKSPPSQTASKISAMVLLLEGRIALHQTNMSYSAYMTSYLREVMVGCSNRLTKIYYGGYGIPHRLEELKQVLEARRVQLGLEHDQIKQIAPLEKDAKADSMTKLIGFSANLANLKEMVTIVTYATLEPLNKLVALNSLIYQKNLLEGFKTKLQAFTHVDAEVSKLLNHRITEIEKLFAYRAKACGIKEDELSTGKGENLKFDPYSAVIDEIVGIKEALKVQMLMHQTNSEDLLSKQIFVKLYKRGLAIVIKVEEIRKNYPKFLRDSSLESIDDAETIKQLKSMVESLKALPVLS